MTCNDASQSRTLMHQPAEGHGDILMSKTPKRDPDPVFSNWAQHGTAIVKLYKHIGSTFQKYRSMFIDTDPWIIMPLLASSCGGAAGLQQRHRCCPQEPLQWSWELSPLTSCEPPDFFWQAWSHSYGNGDPLFSSHFPWAFCLWVFSDPFLASNLSPLA